MPKIAIRY